MKRIYFISQPENQPDTIVYADSVKDALIEFRQAIGDDLPITAGITILPHVATVKAAEKRSAHVMHSVSIEAMEKNPIPNGDDFTFECAFVFSEGLG